MPGAWELNTSSVLIAVLNGREQVNTKWALALRKLEVPIPHNFSFPAGMPFDHARNTSVAVALHHGFTWLFFIDDDVIVPPNAFTALAAHRLDIVSGLYVRRSPPVGLPVMLRETIQEVSGKPVRAAQHITDFTPGSLIEADLVGAGCLLIHRRVLERLWAPLEGRLFRWMMEDHVPEGQRCSEDFWFNREARKAGFRIHVDTSVQCGHVGFAEARLGMYGPVEIR